jgi:hypothetical protein
LGLTLFGEVLPLGLEAVILLAFAAVCLWFAGPELPAP